MRSAYIKKFNKGMAGAEGIGLIGITGPSCSGKTSLAKAVAGRRPNSAAVLSFDEYDLFPVGSSAMDLELQDRTITNWEDPALFDEEAFIVDVAKIALGESVHLQTRSRESIERGETERTFGPQRLNLIEGLFVLRDARARKVMDLTVFVHIPLELMVERRLRDRQDDGMPWSDPDYIKGPMVEATKRFVMPQREFADIVLRGELPPARLAKALIDNSDWL